MGLPTTVSKDFLLWIIARLPPLRQKCSHLKCLRLAFSKARYSLVRDSYHQEYS